MSGRTELRDVVYEANRELVARGLVVYTFGNVSGIDRGEGIIAIKPSGVPYGDLSPDAMVLVDMEGTVVDSPLRPSSDTPTHLVLYRSFPTIGGVAHTHSTFATAWAQACRDIPCLGTTHADYCHGPVPCTAMLDDDCTGDAYEEETGHAIVRRLESLSCDDIPMALVAGHGPFTWGASPAEAVHHSVILEELAHTALLTLSIDAGAKSLPHALLERHFLRKHGGDAYYGQETP